MLERGKKRERAREFHKRRAKNCPFKKQFLYVKSGVVKLQVANDKNEYKNIDGGTLKIGDEKKLSYLLGSKMPPSD